MNNFWTQIEKPFLALAPMAGITDQPFRLICKEFGADVLYSEMISSEALFHNANSKHEIRKSKQIRNSNSQIIKTLKLIQFSRQEQPYIVQIFGADPEHMAFAAEYIATGKWQKDFKKIRSTNFEIRNKPEFSKFKKFKTLENYDFENCFEFRDSNFEFSSIPNGIDINMSCPAKDVIKTGAGAALIKNPKLAEKIIKTIKKKVKNIPISVKTRIGWNDNKSIGSFARMCEQFGADAIAIHGRTVKQGFSGEVDWETIYKIKKALKIPVIGNGGITCNNQLSTFNSQQSTINGQLDGYMIGNGALGKPWIFEKLKTKSEKIKTINNIKKIVLKHAELVKELKGEQGIVEFRKHLGWYFSGMPNVKKIRKQLVNVNNLKDVKKILSQI